MNGISTRLHWTDQPYVWHVNDGEVVFVVIDGVLEIKYRENGLKKSSLLQSDDIFHATVGTEHVAYPQGEARIPSSNQRAASKREQVHSLICTVRSCSIR